MDKPVWTYKLTDSLNDKRMCLLTTFKDGVFHRAEMVPKMLGYPDKVLAHYRDVLGVGDRIEDLRGE